MIDSVLNSLGSELGWQALGSMLAVVVAIASGLPALGRTPVHPTRLLVGAWLAAALPAGLTRLLFIDWFEPGTERLRVTTYGAEFLLAPVTAGPAIAMTLALCGFAAVRSGTGAGQRRWARSAWVAAGGLAIAVVLPVVGHQTPNAVFADLRAVIYVLLALCVAAAVSSPSPRAEGGPDAALSTALLLPLVVAVGEGSERGLIWFVASMMTSSVAPEWWAEFVTRIRATVAPEWWGSWGALGLAAVSAAAGIDRTAFVRTAGTWVVGVGLSAAILYGSELSPARLQVLSVLCTGQPPDVPGSAEQSDHGDEQPDVHELEAPAEDQGTQP